uniref:Secreted protein n=1 Tax=Macrostomum lignano TaxID=282301 RepID=A0A1I8IBY7_9PLAT
MTAQCRRISRLAGPPATCWPRTGTPEPTPPWPTSSSQPGRWTASPSEAAPLRPPSPARTPGRRLAAPSAGCALPCWTRTTTRRTSRGRYSRCSWTRSSNPGPLLAGSRRWTWTNGRL